jgi:HAD superfamily hydrolase (TIGR01490 family)
MVRPRAAVFFDMDGTLLRGESQFAFLLQCWRDGLAPRIRALHIAAAAKYAVYSLGLSRDATEIRAAGFALLAGVSLERLESAGTGFFNSKLAHCIRRQSAALVTEHRENGHITVLVTGTCESLARPVAARLGFESIIATRLLTHEGFCTGERELPEPYGIGKQQIVERFCARHCISPNDCFAYANHHTDLSLLEFVGHPIAVNPTRKLQAIAETRKWPIVDLDSLATPHVPFPNIVRLSSSGDKWLPASAALDHQSAPGR